MPGVRRLRRRHRAPRGTMNRVRDMANNAVHCYPGHTRFINLLHTARIIGVLHGDQLDDPSLVTQCLAAKEFLQSAMDANDTSAGMHRDLRELLDLSAGEFVETLAGILDNPMVRETYKL